MSELKRTQLYDVHVAAGATMVDFGGWEMPIQYPSGIIAEHLYTRQVCSLFDVSHMGRLLIEGPQRKEFLQHVLTSNVSALDLNMAQYCIIPNENGGAVLRRKPGGHHIIDLAGDAAKALGQVAALQLQNPVGLLQLRLDEPGDHIRCTQALHFLSVSIRSI